MILPGKEILQPNILDTPSFMAWKDEAFDLWTSEWGNLYEPDSASFKILQVGITAVLFAPLLLGGEMLCHQGSDMRYFNADQNARVSEVLC